MPVILRKEHEDHWLSGASLQTAESGKFLVPYPANEMTLVRVSPPVKPPDADDGRLLRALDSSGGTQTFLSD